MNHAAEAVSTREGDGYLSTLGRLIRRPAAFFQELPRDAGWGRPFKFLLISSALHTAAAMALSAMTPPGELPLAAGAARFINALGMPLVMAGLAFLPTLLLPFGRPRPSRLFAVFAYSGGVILLISWLSAFVWFGESMRWILAGFGLVHGCGFSRVLALGVMAATIVMTVLLFQFLT